ncbi:hypothetical protein LUZ60_005060 [Juncus effusus]|nr:hypothetical protein LUZ60_005060 [Juncus effusus]
MSPSSILSLILFSSFLVYSSLAATDTELSILLSLKNSIKIPTNNSQTFSSWSSTNSKCSFNGVTCNSNSSVSSIYLNGLGITGTIRFDSLCELPSLTNLSLGANGLTGTLNGVQTCMSLLTLDLSFNEFNGTVPDLSPLKNLRILNISDNSFTGPFPWDSLGNLTELLVLSLGDNSFDQIDTFPSKILNLTKLYWLYLSDTNIGGKIPPEIGNLTELQDLELSDNFFFGEIPPEITKLTKLYQLELYNNSLTGTIPPGFGTLTNLAYFDASMNNLQGNLSELRSLTNIISLQLFYNDFSGEIPPEFGDFKFLVNLSLYSNRLTGQLPQKIGSWAEFNFIDVSTNYLTGPIPPDMCKKGTMIKLLILENQFTGEIPINYANCSSLTRFRVNNNSLTGTVPTGIWGLPNVNIIDLSINNFEGEITADISGAKNLYQLYLANNKFSGKIPLEISNANSIVNIDISFNDISGEIPDTIGQLEDLVTLDLHGNKITGIIPNSIGTCSSLNTINLSQNNLSGQIPSSLGQLTRLNSLDLSSNQLTGEIPSTLSSLKLSSLSLANNQLSGPVPASLSIDAYSSSFSGNPNLCLNNKLGFLKSCSGVRTKSSDRVRTVLTCVISVIAVILALIGLYIVIKRTTRSKTDSTTNPYFKKKGSWDLKSFRVLRVDEREIIEEIKEENLIGRGMSGNVYRVKLGSGVEVAVKHIVSEEESANGEATRGGASGTDAMLGNGNRSASVRCREFEAEVGTLSSIRHVNVVNLYCSITSADSNSNLLVYEYLPNGSLYDKLHTSQKSILDWETRFDIAVGSARGLEYLHHGCERMILHRDVKSSNILLDEWFKPRIADFGLAKILKMGSGRDGEVSRGVITGTHGYIAPEYAYNWWKVNEKSDVYSFGVVLLELITGKKPIETEFGQNKDIVYWVSQKVDSKDKIMDLIDSRIKESWAREEAIKMLSIAVMCTARVPSVRPSMRRVVQLLEEVANCRSFVGITCERNTKVDQVKLSP